MALVKYQELLKYTKDKVKECMAPLRAREMRKKAELEVAKIEGFLAEKEQTIQEESAKYPIDFDKLLNAIDDLELTKRRKDQFNNIINELFGD